MTPSDPFVTIDLGDAHGTQRVALSAVQKAVNGYLQRGHYGTAVSLATQLAAQLPGVLWPHLVAGEFLLLQQQTDAARQYIDRALAIDPSSIASLIIKARLCMLTGDDAEGRRLIDSAVALAPELPKLHGVRAELLLDTGDIEAARDSYLECIRLDPRNAAGLLGLAMLPEDHFSEELIRMTEFIAGSSQLPAEEQIKVHFALAHAYDKKNDIAAHFRHLHAGNALQARTAAFDAEAAAKEADDIIRCFPPALFDRPVDASAPAPGIIFIVGFPRCGSTLVEQILSSHPAVAAAGETLALPHAIREFEQSRKLPTKFPHWIGEQSVGSLAEIGNDYLHRVHPLFQRARLTDKLLDNYKLIGLIELVFPGATIIHVERHPIDTCYSCYKRLFNLGSVPFTYNLESLAHAYRNYRRVMRHWNDVLPGRIHTVTYEQLVSDQERVTRDLLAHCRLPWDDACLQFHRNARTVQTNSNAQVRRPLYTDAVDRWKNHAAYLGPLLELTND